ncbi:hypothetical protein [Sediminibacterium salmoneum]|uniref:hypothetical protein n=1 Tax=Sediminibacterium salmoneum TaxID=426421 RepID=UPI00047ADFED|nr:hypothetical protein [Sediminibacterium salmoneum]
MRNQFRFLAITFCFTLLTISLQAQNKEPNLKFGKYGCTATKYINGFYQYSPKGSFIINKNGSYTYLGFEKPSTGKFTVDEKGNLQFKGGYFDGGKAEKIDTSNRFFLVFPSNPDNRWTCSLTDKQ